MNDEHFEKLIGNHLDGTLSSEERNELEQRLLHSAADRERFWREAETHAMLYESLQTSIAGESVRPAAELFRSRRWMAWRPFISLAASTFFGVLCTSLVFGFVLPRIAEEQSRSIGPADGSFETTDRSMHSGLPSEFGVWGGYGVEIVECHEVKASDGERMLLLVESPTPRNPLGNARTRRDAFQLVDLSSLKSEMDSSDVTMELSAKFLDARESTGKRKPVKLTTAIYVFSGHPDQLRAEWPRSREASLTTASTFIKSSGIGVPKWRPITIKTQLPPEANFVLVHLFLTSEKNESGIRPTEEFGKQFVDDVRLTIKSKPIKLEAVSE